MPNLCCALTATSRDSGNATQPLLHPCLWPHLATNPGTQATLHHYHPGGDEVNTDSGRVRVRETTASVSSQIVDVTPRKRAVLLRTKRCN